MYMQNDYVCCLRHNPGVRVPVRHRIPRCAAEGARTSTLGNILLAHAKVSNFHVSRGAEHNVVQLQVAVKNLVVVQIPQTKTNLCGVKSCPWNLKHLYT